MRPPRKAIAHDAKMASSTTNRSDYVTHPITPPPKKLPIVYQPPDGSMETSSEYKETFQGKWADPAQPIVPPATRSDTTQPFSHATTHGTDFIPKPITPQQSCKAQDTYKPPSDAFEGSSTSQSVFVDYGDVPMTPSCKPIPKANVSSQPFEGASSYRSTFTVPSMPKKFQRPKEVYKPSNEKFSNSTTFKSDFPKYSSFKRPESVKPPQNAFDNFSIPFEASTTNRQSYRVWELPSRISRPPTVFQPPTEKFSTDTSFKSDFRDPGHVIPVTSFKPVEKRKDQNSPFECLTTQGNDYKVWNNATRPPAITHEKKYEPPKDKFETVSTFQSHYKGQSVPRTPSMKPVRQACTNSSKMDTMTSYRECYSGSGYKACPSAGLLADPTKTSQYSYSHMDNSGHKYFKVTNC